MISVLIPIYNFNVAKLVKDLHAQLTYANVVFEIILGDDASTQQYNNEKLTDLQGVSYFSLPENIGRAKMRNLLVEKAIHPFLLFMDCDAAVSSGLYINNYIVEISRNPAPVCIIGGVAYRLQKPNPKYYLRWYYGKKREATDADIRNRKPYKSFTSFNAVFSKSIFDLVKFDESFSTYGNEDTFFGDQLRNAQISVIHINNPLYHDGLDTNEEYLHKVETSIDNLISLLNSKKIDSNFVDENRLLATYFKCKKLKAMPTLRVYYKKYLPKIKQKILKKPSIFWLDVYKLGYLMQNL
ncbi:MAG: glycosyltransferase [Bacteroidetes bacterium]|nr:glycosyltransferase [Bacteroidota bacterium]MCL2302711.1 glycosyltransferase [Lentimicrobiaceae bacterium]